MSQALLTIFVESSLGASRQDSDSARRSLMNRSRATRPSPQTPRAASRRSSCETFELQSQSGLDSAGRAAEIGNLLSQARLEPRS